MKAANHSITLRDHTVPSGYHVILLTKKTLVLDDTATRDAHLPAALHHHSFIRNNIGTGKRTHVHSHCILTTNHLTGIVEQPVKTEIITNLKELEKLVRSNGTPGTEPRNRRNRNTAEFRELMLAKSLHTNILQKSLMHIAYLTGMFHICNNYPIYETSTHKNNI